MPFLLSQMLEFCRWAGAFIVMAVHSTNMFVSLKDIMTAPHAPQVYVWWFFAAFELGHQAVISFFVMSGYLVGGAVLNSIKKQKDFIREYLIHRFARIYVVTVPALFFTLLVDMVGRNLPNASIYASDMFQGRFEPLVFAGNIVNLQEIYVPCFGTNSPLWSLACEFWYYMAFPLLAAPLARNYPVMPRMIAFALGVMICVVMSVPAPWFRLGFVLWVMGALATLPKKPLLPSRWLAVALYVAAVVPVRLLVRGPLLAEHPWLSDAADVFCSLVFCNLMLTVRHSSPEGWNLLRPAYHKRLADFSFSLYCTHMPMLILMRAVADSVMGSGWASELATPAHWATLAAAMTIMIVAAFGFSRLTEHHTGAARRLLGAVLPRYALAPS
ncbi:MAG TPA: acyltransferase family protein [Methylocystis sp.]|nr:acyltransferase family protein [Methylocystis sp.]